MVHEALEESKRKRAKLAPKLMEANKDLRARIEDEGVAIEYLAEDDYLRLTIGTGARESMSVTHHDGVYVSLMVDPESLKVTGLEAPSFFETRENTQSQPLQELWRIVVELIGLGEGASAYIPSKRTLERAERASEEAFRELVST